MVRAMFPSQSPKVSGALAQSPNHKPSTEGSIIYLNANPDLKLVLDKVEDAGGKVTMPKLTLAKMDSWHFSLILKEIL